jgi:transglutaminase-like putative cysteine protease
MRISRWSIFLCLFAVVPGRAADKPAMKPIEEVFEVAVVDGSRVGHVVTTVHRHDKEGKQLRTTSTLELTLRRYGAIVRLRKEEGSVETPEGKLLAVFMRQGQAGGRQLVLTGIVEDEKLHVKIDNGRIERRLRWSAEVLGLRQQEQFFVRKKPNPGDKFTFLRFDPTYNAVVTLRIEVKERESVDVLGTRRSLLRIDMTPDKLEAPGVTIRPPKIVWWLDDKFVPIRKQTELEGLGALLLTRGTRDKALAAGTTGTLDVGTRSLVALNRGFPRPYDTRSVVYRVTVRGEDDPATVLVRDSHQEIRNVKGDTFELHVHPVQSDSAAGNIKPAGEYLASCHFIDNGDARIKELARKAAGGEKEEWKKALRIERWVKSMMRIDNSAALAPASEVAKTCRGDCRHHALLTAALCRAEGIPSRTAIGLLYVYKGGPVLGFHMWTEVCIDGRWLGLDSTLGKGGVSAVHVKVSDHSWTGTESLTPLLPVSRILGKLRVEVLSAGGSR